MPGALETLAGLRARGLDLAVVSNWDVGLAEHLERIGPRSLFSAIVTSAEAGAAKPDPDRLPARARAARASTPAARSTSATRPRTRRARRAAGMRFALAPLATAFEGWL